MTPKHPLRTEETLFPGSEIRAHATTLDRLPVGSLFRFSATPGTGSYKNLSTVQLDALRSVCVVVRQTGGLTLVKPTSDINGLNGGAEVWYISSMAVVAVTPSGTSSDAPEGATWD